MATWFDDSGSDSALDAFDPNRYYIGGSSLPKMRRSRKRSYASAGLLEDSFLEDFERRLKLTQETKERLEVADALVENPQFRVALMKGLPDADVRNMARISSVWRNDAYRTLRERRGNNGFSLMWVSDEQGGTTSNNDFDLGIFLHPAYLGGRVPNPEKIVKGIMPLESAVNFNNQNQAANPVEPVQIGTLAKVGFILTYGSANMQSEILATEQDENKTMKSATLNASTLMVLSSSIIASTPDCKRILDTAASYDRKLVTSIMIPESAHILLECFLVPSSLSQSTPCISSVIGNKGLNKQPKVLILYQYLNLVDSKPGIVEVLNYLKLTQGSSGFPMITGIYDYLDGNVMTKESDGPVNDPVASGLLICGDDFCNTLVMSMNLLNAVNGTMEIDFKKIIDFYSANAFSTKYALLFYHNEVASNDCEGNLNFKFFIQCFQKYLPDVRLLGIGSLSGAHGMFINPEANESFNQLNINMMGLTGTVEAKTSVASMEIILVLLSYQAD